MEGQTFTGVVDNVSINGTTAGGATSYPVTILIKDYGDLKPGMNVSATIEGDRVPNALCIPVDAVNRGNTVTVPGPGAMNADNTAVAASGCTIPKIVLASVDFPVPDSPTNPKISPRCTSKETSWSTS